MSGCLVKVNPKMLLVCGQTIPEREPRGNYFEATERTVENCGG